MNDLALAWRLEEACLNAWPSPRQLVLDTWLLRFSGGPTRRTNSVNPLRAGAHDSEAIIPVARRLYRAQGQAALFRVPSFVTGMDGPLARAHFTKEGEACTLFAGLRGVKVAAGGDVDISREPGAAWLDAKSRLTPLSEADRRIYLRMLDAIVLPKAFVAARHETSVVSVAYGAIHDDLLVIESVATDEAVRHRGFASRVIGRLFEWARHEGCSGATLQVVADNAPARSLYARLGFHDEFYRYHYRRELRLPIV